MCLRSIDERRPCAKVPFLGDQHAGMIVVSLARLKARMPEDGNDDLDFIRSVLGDARSDTITKQMRVYPFADQLLCQEAYAAVDRVVGERRRTDRYPEPRRTAAAQQ